MDENNTILNMELSKMKKLDAESYSKLLSIYGEDMVNKTI